MADVEQVARMWSSLKSVKSDMLRDFHAKVKLARADKTAEFVGAVSDLLATGVRKGTICSQAGVSRTTLDRLLIEFGAAVSTYRFVRGYATSVWIKGKLPDTGGFPTLSGEVEARFVDRGFGVYVARDDLTGQHKHGAAEKEFLTERYGVEATAWAVAEGLTKPAPVEDWEVEDEV
jgi:hypothetical protein